MNVKEEILESAVQSTLNVPSGLKQYCVLMKAYVLCSMFPPSGEAVCWAPGRVAPADIAPSRRAQEGRGRATAVPLVQSPPAERAGATPRDPLFAVRSVRAQGRMSVGKGQAKPFYTRKRPVRCSDAVDRPSSGRLLLSSRRAFPAT